MSEALRASRLPVESDEDGASWLSKCAATLGSVLLRPRAAFSTCPEPVPHARVLRFLATLRLPPWVLLITVFGVRLLTSDGPDLAVTLPIHAFVDPALVRAFSTWILFLIPVGLPLLYFCTGLLAHVGIALTGGAPRSIGVTMRAVGYAMGPALVAIGMLDVPLYLHYVPGAVYMWILAGVCLHALVTAGVALTRTHRISPWRGQLVAWLPIALLATVTLGRAATELEQVVGLPAPPSPYFVP